MDQSTYQELLKNRGFCAYLLTQFLGVINDNAFRFIVTYLATDIIIEETGSVETSIVPIIGGVFVLPFILFSGYGGYLGDAYNKRSVLISTKSMEIFSMLLGIAALYTQSIPMMLFVLFLMTTQSTLFSPAKYGILPEMIPYNNLSKANGLLEMSTFLGILLGTILASLFYTWWAESIWYTGIYLTIIALTGTLVSLWITKVPNPEKRPEFTINPWSEIYQGTRNLYRNRPLWLTIIAITYFWFIGALIQQNIIQMGTELNYSEILIGAVFSTLALGIGMGCIAAGWLSGGKVELGFVLYGALGLSLSCFCMYILAFSWIAVLITGFVLGFSGGFFSVPLYAFLQAESGANEKGRFLATSNFINTIGILLASVLLMTAYSIQIPTLFIYPIGGIFTLIITGILIVYLPVQFFRLFVIQVFKLHYHVRVTGIENVPDNGPALLVSNHISLLDGFAIANQLERVPKFLVYKDFFEPLFSRWLLHSIDAIPIKPDNRRNFMSALKQARNELDQGRLVGIFAEGAISRNGNLTSFKGGMERIVKDSEIPIIPIHIAGLWKSRFSYNPNKKKWGLQSFKRIQVELSFGNPLPANTKSYRVRNTIAELSCDTYKNLLPSSDGLHLLFIQSVKRNKNSLYAADTTGKHLTYRKILAAAFVLSRWINKNCSGEKNIGIMLPSTVFGTVVNVAVSLSGKTAVNINFTAGETTILYSLNQCGIKTVITSKKFLKKININELPSMRYVEELSYLFSKTKMLAAYTQTYFPYFLLKKWYSSPQSSIEDTATILFSSGSSGKPKGVMLSHRSIVTNLNAVSTVFQIQPDDKMAGLLPFFHAFGYTATVWFPLIQGFSVVYHTNPFETKAIGDLVEKHDATLLISTPTFFHSYCKKIPAHQFQSLRLSVTGAEKLSPTVRELYQNRFGKLLFEGYGCTEMGPVVSVNVPDMDLKEFTQQCNKVGTVGQPVPGVCAKIVDIESFVELEPNQEGILLVKGPNLMQGYLHDEEQTKSCIKDGWYNTGDIAKIDEDGFICITDRLSRFCKIGGEMVPLIHIEELINTKLQNGRCSAAPVPDDKRGERIVLFYSYSTLNPAGIREILLQADIPNLWIPKIESIQYIDEIPVLPSGKVDLQKIKSMALAINN